MDIAFENFIGFGVVLLISVVVAASGQDKKFINALQNILSRNFNSIHSLGGCIDTRCGNAELLFTDAQSYELIYSDTAIVIFRDGTGISADFETNRPVVAVVDSCSRDALRIVSETGFPAITCGLSPRDTVTLSSINEDSAVIDLQRSVTCFDGAEVEPQEIPVSLCSPVDSFALMCAAIIFILSGNIDRLSKVKI